AVPEIVKELAKHDCHVPWVGECHYNGHTLLSKYPECATALAKYRINRGNVGMGKKNDPPFAVSSKIALALEKQGRI
ncbi:4-hydroxy-3-methylbut-2-en-1-yl diphosphate synthase, partial [Francisella tularensis subsp. holarctica]|nr:4-hydroxy-3-methylbut-2-en-1-yl diphosphate synthase [Francisella tularensis subsp. holarctica]